MLLFVCAAFQQCIALHSYAQQVLASKCKLPESLTIAPLTNTFVNPQRTRREQLLASTLFIKGLLWFYPVYRQSSHSRRCRHRREVGHLDTGRFFRPFFGGSIWQLNTAWEHGGYAPSLDGPLGFLCYGLPWHLARLVLEETGFFCAEWMNPYEKIHEIVWCRDRGHIWSIKMNQTCVHCKNGSFKS